MGGNTFGKILRLTTFGESHGPGLGGVLDGCPAGLSLTEEDIQRELDLRKPGSGASGTTRRESDTVRLLSGVLEGVTTGTPIGFYIANEDQRSRDYANIAEIFRPGHADWTYFCKFNGIRDYRGGGRASGRETAARVAGGAIAKRLLLAACGTKVRAAAIEFGGVAVAEEDIDMAGAEGRPYFAATAGIVSQWDQLTAEARQAGDTLGGIIRISAVNVPPGLGEPVFDRLDAMLAHGVMSLGAVKGVSIGSGFEAARMKGSLNNDAIVPAGGSAQGHIPAAKFLSNNAGGILGGISTGQEIVLDVAVKPTASIGREQDTINKRGQAVKIAVGGRHDLSAIPRIAPALTAMTALVLADALLLQKRMDLRL